MGVENGGSGNGDGIVTDTSAIYTTQSDESTVYSNPVVIVLFSFSHIHAQTRTSSSLLYCCFWLGTAHTRVHTVSFSFGLW